ncbi:MAG: hypothetical protein PHI84_11690 [Kiritimatiellae bacterium]|nr:hypothetical protein [Kiritimatiellia bacterium]
MIKKQFTLYLENKPGELARVTRVLAIEKVNIEGISVSAGSDVGLVQLIANNASATNKGLAKARVPFTVQDVSVIPLRNEPGALELVVSKLAAVGININYIYATSCLNKNCKCHVVISAPDLRKVEAVCNKCL